MALCSLRLRRALSLSSFLLHQHFHSPKLLSPLHSSSSALFGPQNPRTTPSFSDFHSFRHFRSSPISLSSRNRRFESDDQMEITADTILFEGCDYNHWLITVDFPRDVDIPAEQKVQKYVEIAAGVFGSEEEAKKRIYACSTTTYQGFQVECSEETSEKFKENPAVVFVLPDSYIDPVNKEYGGDKYINGTIIPRPPPIMSVRRNPRQFSRPQRPENWGSGPGDARNFGPQQSHPSQQNFGPQQNHPTQQNFGPRQNHTTQQNHPTQQNFGPQQNYAAQQNFGPPRGPVSQQNYSPPQNTPPQQTYGQQQNAPPRQYYGTPENTTAHQNYGYHSPQHNYGQSHNHPNQQNYGPPQNFTPQQNNGSPGMHSPIRQNYGQPGGIEGQSYTPSQGGTFHQGIGGAPAQEMGPAYGQNYPRHGEDQKFSEVDQRSRFPSGDQRNFA
ncbi:uncharacterized protein [Coffea arabica]|uniref:Uncharacterized protein isoform X2 n=1 Tax=Coffea arabica TaxID=13443 RepID=A0A6P6WHH1_COFAR|nr:multiple organellar RNA editing factor 1, mitochondrial isoform X2 [Coffea arabica]